MKIGFSTSVIQRGKTGVAQYVFALLRAMLAHVAVGIVLGRQEQDSQVTVVAQVRQAHLQGAPGSPPPGLVAIEGKHHPIGQAQQALEVVWCGRRAERGDRIGDALGKLPRPGIPQCSSIAFRSFCSWRLPDTLFNITPAIVTPGSKC